MAAPTMEQARALLARADGLSREDLQKELVALPAEARAAYYKLRKDSFFVPENAGTLHEYLSPSGKYRLVVTPYATSPGAWGYTQGLVYEVGSDAPIAEIRRNYSSFPHLFIEDHPNGHPYLIGGENYQGQTVVELDTGRRRDFLPAAADKGFGFCWAQMRFDASSRILTVDGCIWACPYEYRFYDFADPMSGWPELKVGEGDDILVYAEDRWPKFREGGTIVCFQLDHFDGEDEDHDEEDANEELPPEQRLVAATLTFRREGDTLSLVSEDVTEKEQRRRVANAEAERKYAEWKADFRLTDPLYLACAAHVKDPTLSPESHESVGYTFSGWCPGTEYAESRWCRRIVSQKGAHGYVIDLEWGVKTGPIKLVIYKNGGKHEERFFDHSVEGMDAAFAYAKALVTGGVS